MDELQQKIEKLPVWAKEHIRDLQRQRDESVRALNRQTDDQTPAPFFVTDYAHTGESRGPSFKRRYFQGNKIEVIHAGVHARIHLADKDDGQRDFGIEITWEPVEGSRARFVAMVPKAWQNVQLIAKENLR